MPIENTPRQLIALAERRFREADLCYGHGTDNPLDEAAFLVLGALELPFDTEDERLDEQLDQQRLSLIQDLLERRVRERVPVAYLINCAWFCGFSFYVDNRVLIPRSPIAELIEERFSPWMPEVTQPAILDIGTGSGCIAIACAYAFPDARVDAVDLDAGALAVAAGNIERHGMEDRIRLIRSDLFDQLGDRCYDLIISNPPYVGTGGMDNLPMEYSHEPVAALCGGADGLEVIRRIMERAGAHMNAHGLLVVEVGAAQGEVSVTFPDLPFLWLDFERGGEGVFLLSAEDLSCSVNPE